MSFEFGKVLAGLREELGCQSAYEFFHKHGGRKILGFGYKQYLNLESGVSLPRPETLMRLCRMLSEEGV